VPEKPQAVGYGNEFRVSREPRYLFLASRPGFLLSWNEFNVSQDIEKALPSLESPKTVVRM
jgi:hypothetical protein